MFRYLFVFLVNFLFFNGLNAQTAARPTTQDLSPAEALRQKETAAVDRFSRALSSLKSAFAEKDASRIVAYEAQILRGMREATEQLSEKSPEPGTKAKLRLEKTTSTLKAFEAHSFDPSKPEVAARDFALLDEFLLLMKEGLQ